jgi:hypothetical protein
MGFSIEYFAFGLIALAISLLIASVVEKRWRKIAILLLGTVVAVIVISIPSITFFVGSPQAPSDAEIFHLLYGEDIAIQESLNGETVYIVEELSGVEKEQYDYAVQVNTHIVGKVRGWDQDPQKILVLTRTGPPACCDRSQLPVLGGALFSWKDGSWLVDGYQKLITPYGSFDHYEAGEIEVIGPQKTAVVLQDEYGGDGVSQTWDLLIGEVDGRLKVIGKIETSANNAEVCPPAAETEPCWAYAAAYEFTLGENPGYNDIVVSTSGTKIVGGDLVTFEETTQLVFSNGEYRIAGND